MPNLPQIPLNSQVKALVKYRAQFCLSQYVALKLFLFLSFSALFFTRTFVLFIKTTTKIATLVEQNFSMMDRTNAKVWMDGSEPGRSEHWLGLIIFRVSLIDKSCVLCF